MFYEVVPLVGTWIEIYLMSYFLPDAPVVPLVGTWIEISKPLSKAKIQIVVPLVGTWIEILISRLKDLSEKGRFPRGKMHWNSYQNE